MDIANNSKDNKEVADEDGETSKDNMYNIRISKIVNKLKNVHCTSGQLLNHP